MTLTAVAAIATLILTTAGQSPLSPRPPVALAEAAASDLSGRVMFSGLPVPGATVSATRDTRTLATVSDAEGAFRLTALDDGPWTVRVEMRGFAAVTREVTLPLAEPSLSVPLTMQTYKDIVGREPSVAAASSPTSQTPATSQKSPTSSTAPTSPTFGVAADAAAQAPPPDAADVINGSVNNGAATPFAQSPAFGNNRPRSSALYTGGVTAIIGNSALNARPFSFGGSAVSTPSYSDAQVGFVLGGPLKIPHVLKNGPQMFVAYQHSDLHSANTQSALMPTSAERTGDLSQSGVTARDPLTGLPFPNNVIPANRINPQAAALLAYYPLPNVQEGGTAGGSNYQTPVVTATTQDNLQLRLTKSATKRTTLGGAFAFQRSVGDSANLFDFADTSRQSSLTGDFSWTRRFTPRLSIRASYDYTRTAASSTPFFANRRNVSADAGITGNSQDSASWGPPTLSFPDVAGLRDVEYQDSLNQIHGAGAEASLKHGRHNVTMGGDLRSNSLDVSSQPDPRGTLAFTGAATGNAFGDFLLGIPTTSAIAFGDTRARLRGASSDAYVTDDWRTSGLTLNLGVRWEYEAPLTESSGRLVNLDVAPGFAATSPVLATNPVGSLTGTLYPASLVRPDKRGIEPRLATSWRPRLGSSLVIHASYGLYRNLGVYQPLALLLAQQPPFTKTVSVQNNSLTPLTLANPFPSSLPSANTFAVDPGFRPGYAHTWQASAQHDLPGSLTALAAYLGAQGSHLMQASLPNTYPAGAANPCPACPSGFVYVSSNGSSLRNAGQFTLRRRLHNGLTASVQYTVAKSTDNAATFSNTLVTPQSLAIAQDWLNLAGERGPSSFDQRQLLSVQFQYTSGVGVAGGTLVDGGWGTLFKDWTIASQLSAGSGMPFTPVSFTAVAGTGFVGVRPQLTGVPLEPAPSGAYVNPAAFTSPVPGAWGDAGRNSIRGPAQFSLDASLARVFRLRGRLNLEWRIAATNVLNRVTFATINTVVTSPQFGLPTLANPMRRVQTTARLRF